MGRSFTLLSALALLAAVGPEYASADMIAITQPTNTSMQFSGVGTLGYEFETGAVPLAVTALGAWDESTGSSSFAVAHAIAIWDTSGNQLTTGTVPAGAGVNQLGDYSFVAPDTPLVLAANTDYVIGVDQNNESFHNSLFPAQAVDWPVFNSPSVTEIERRADFGGGLVYPASNFGGGSAWDAVNFQFTAVPEPSSLVLLLIGAISGLGLRFRSKSSPRQK